jgi:hypothetical protein
MPQTYWVSIGGAFRLVRDPIATPTPSADRPGSPLTLF